MSSLPDHGILLLSGLPAQLHLFDNISLDEDIVASWTYVRFRRNMQNIGAKIAIRRLIATIRGAMCKSRVQKRTLERQTRGRIYKPHGVMASVDVDLSKCVPEDPVEVFVLPPEV